MKFLTSVIVLVAIFSTAKAWFASEMESMSQTVAQQYDPSYTTSFTYYFPQMSQYSTYFDGSYEQMMSSSYPADTLTADQKLAMTYVFQEKHCYRNVFNCLNDTTNNYVNWVNGNYTKYGPIFQALVQEYDDAIKAADAAMQKRAGCGENDRMSARMQMIMPAYTVFYSGYSNSLSSFQGLYSMVNMNLLTSIQNMFSFFMWDSDPMGYIKAYEATTIYPNHDLMLAQINNLGETMLWLITKSLEAQVANAKTSIAGALTIAQTYQCTGQ